MFRRKSKRFTTCDEKQHFDITSGDKLNVRDVNVLIAILVPRGRDPFDQDQNSRPLARADILSSAEYFFSIFSQ